MNRNRYATAEEVQDPTVRVERMSGDELVDEIIVDRTWSGTLTRTSIRSKAPSETDDELSNDGLHVVPELSSQPAVTAVHGVITFQ